MEAANRFMPVKIVFYLLNPIVVLFSIHVRNLVCYSAFVFMFECKDTHTHTHTHACMQIKTFVMGLDKHPVPHLCATYHEHFIQIVITLIRNRIIV